MTTTHHTTLTPQVQAATMARICATGIPTDVAEIEAQIRELIEQRDGLLVTCKAVLDSIYKHHAATGDILWIAPPFQAAAIHESAADRLEFTIARAQSTIAPSERKGESLCG